MNLLERPVYFWNPTVTTRDTTVTLKIPIFSYGTQLSEEGFAQCAVAGRDWRQFYKIFSCPRVLMEVKGFGHCDILDPMGWEACHLTHFCTTTNNSRNAEYRRFVQGVISAFLIGTLEGYTDSLGFILNRTRIPLELIDLQSDLSCL
nr:hypothetical protein BaRGS_004177 [Batillaria attramentaria]